MRFYGFEYASGRGTSSGQPNETTGRYNTAGDLNCFETKADRDIWVDDGPETSAMCGNCREAVTVGQARSLHRGMSVVDYDEMLKYIVVDE